MKKILSILLLTLSAFLLFSCSSQDKLDGNYYWIDTENGLRNELSFTIKGIEGTIEKGEYDKFTINSKNNTFDFLVKMLQPKKWLTNILMESSPLILVVLNMSTIKKVLMLIKKPSRNTMNYKTKKEVIWMEINSEIYDNLYDFIQNLEIRIQKNVFHSNHSEQLSTFSNELY